MEVATYVCMYVCMYVCTYVCTIVHVLQGRSQEFSFTEARLKGKGALNAGVLGGTAPQKLMQYIKVTFSILLNSYDNTMA